MNKTYGALSVLITGIVFIILGATGDFGTIATNFIYAFGTLLTASGVFIGISEFFKKFGYIAKNAKLKTKEDKIKAELTFKNRKANSDIKVLNGKITKVKNKNAKVNNKLNEKLGK